MSKLLSVKCPHCEEEVEPDKRVSMAGAAFLAPLYIPYYYWIKKKYCPECKRELSSSDLAGYPDPDNTWKWLSIVPAALILLAILL